MQKFKTLTEKERALWFFRNHYEKGMEIDSFYIYTHDDWDNFIWYDKKITVPNTRITCDCNCHDENIKIIHFMPCCTPKYEFIPPQI